MPKNAPKIPDSPYVQDESKIIIKESLALRWIAVRDIPRLLWEKNPKKHSLSELWDSICKFGFIDPPKFDKNLRNRAGGMGGIQYGNGRSEAVHWGYMAYKSGDYTGDVPRGIGVNSEGEWFIPVKVGVDAASEAMAADFGIFHNTSTMLGGDFSDGDIWRLFEPKELLEIGKMILSDKEFEPLAMNADEVDSLLNFLDGGKTPPDAPDAQIDKAEELNKVWGCKTGDLWIIPSKTGKGEHRLLCGDSTKAEDVARLMGGQLCQLILTDPPYNVDYEGNYIQSGQILKKEEKIWQGGIKNDKLNNFSDWLKSVYSVANGVLSEGAAIYIWHPPGAEGRHFWGAWLWDEWHFQVDLVWNKTSLIISRWDYKPQHEPCMYGWKGKNRKWIGTNNEPTVWDIPRQQGNSGEIRNHPTQKPLECMMRPIGNHDADNVYDPFLGSGTTMVACETLKRSCFGVEIDPKYCAVILERMKGMDLEPFLSSE